MNEVIVNLNSNNLKRYFHEIKTTGKISEKSTRELTAIADIREKNSTVVVTNLFTGAYEIAVWKFSKIFKTNSLKLLIDFDMDCNFDIKFF